MKRWAAFCIIFFILLLAACQQEANPGPDSEGVKEVPKVDEQVDKPDPKEHTKVDEAVSELELADFLMKDGTEAEFKGEGNEFAQYTAKTEWLDDRFVNVLEDNGGTVFVRSFRIDEDKIVVVYESGGADDGNIPTVNELTQLEPEYTYLQLPLTKGATFADWTVVDNHVTLDTPLQTFTDVVVIEQVVEGTFTRKYFSKGFGEIKREVIMKEGDEEFTVSSTIESVK